MSLTITSVNVNGIRAAVKERNPDNPGILPWLGAPTGRRFVLLQEIRASRDQAVEALAPALDAGWSLSMTESSVKGHAGVGVLGTVAPDAVRVGFGSEEFDGTGRYLEIDVAADGDVPALTLGSLYLPKGASDGPKRDEKFRFLDEFGAHLDTLSRRRRGVVVGGDWNIAHSELDLKAWKTNQRSPGFLPEERAWVRGLLDRSWVDVTRALVGDEPGPYSWWSWRGKAFDNDSGWRIDYHLANPVMARRACATRVERADAYDRRWSDHAPVTVEFA
ncbi:MAG: exodeoxyribonuclease III [Corynebacteriales bacterium]|nr:exodeoxyribonuclease III [Mycobacteriales bacterium]